MPVIVQSERPIWPTVTLLLIVSVLLFLLSWWMQRDLLNAGQDYFSSSAARAPVTAESAPPVLVGQIPFRELVFGLRWLGIIGFLAIARYGILTMFGVEQRRLRETFRLTMHSCTPLICVGALLAIAGIVWLRIPPEQAQEVQTGDLLQPILATLLVFAGWLAEGYLCMQAYRADYALSRGQACGIFLGPYAFFALLPLMFAFYRYGVGGF